MFASSFKCNTSSPNFQLLIIFSFQVFIILSITSFSNQVDATNVSEKYRQSDRALRDETRIAQASNEYATHPYGNNFAKLLSKPESALYLQEDPLKTAASHHHHKKGAKGWLDMGAWTKKKGAFGWYADFPVGKGK